MSSGRDNLDIPGNSAPERQNLAGGTAAAGGSNPVASPALSAASAPLAAPSNSTSGAAQQHAGPSFPPFGNLPSGCTQVPINIVVFHRRPRLAGTGSTPQIPLPPTCMPAPTLPGVSEDGASTQYAGSNFLSLGRASETGNESKATQLQQSATTSYCASHSTLESVAPGNTLKVLVQAQQSQESVCLHGKESAHDNTHIHESVQERSKRKISQIERTPSSAPAVLKEKTITQIEMQIAGAEKTEPMRNEETAGQKRKARRKKHRPKVIREDKKPKMQKPVASTPVRKSPELKVKRRYVRKKRSVRSLEKASRAVTDQSMPGGTETAARRSVSVRRSLHFGLEEQGGQGDQTSTANSHQHGVEKLLVHDQSSVCSVTNSEVHVRYEPQVVTENTPGGFALGMSIKLNRFLDDYINLPEVTSEPTQEVSGYFGKQLAREQGNTGRSQEADETSSNSLCFKEKAGMTVPQQSKQDLALNHFIPDDFRFLGRSIPNMEPTRSQTSKVLKTENHTPCKNDEMSLTGKPESIILRTAARMVAQCQTRVIKKKRSDRIPRHSCISILDLQNNSSHESTRLPQPCMDALYKSSNIKPVTKKRSQKVHPQCPSSIEQNLELKNRLSAGRIFYGEYNGLAMSEENFYKSSPWILDNQTVDPDFRCNTPEGSSTSAVRYTDYLQGVPSKLPHHDLNTEQVYGAETGSSLAAPAVISFGGIYGMSNALIPYGTGGVVPYEMPLQVVKRQRPRAKVDLDFETTRVWNLLMGGKTEPVDGTDAEKEKWWQQEREVYQGRANSFIARMRLVQGDRRFSPWKGSVVDSVVGVFLTQNVADHLSSSAYMSLAATFPPRLGNSSCMDNASVSELIKGEKYSADYKTENASDFNQQGMEQKARQMSYLSSVELTASTEVRQQMQFQSEISSSQSVITHQSRLPLSFGVARNFLGDGSTAAYQQLGKNFDHGKSLTGNFTVTSEIECQRLKAIAVDADDVGEPETSGSSMLFCSTIESQQLHLINEPIVSSGSVSPYIKSSKDEKAAHFFVPCDFRVAETSGHKTSTATRNCPEIIREPAVDHDKKTAFEAPGIQEHESLFVTDEMVAEPTRKEDECSVKSDSTSHNGVLGAEAKASRTKKTATASKKNTENFDWDELRRQVCGESHAKERSFERKDSVDWEAVRCADVQKISDAIRERGMNNILAERIQNFLNRLVRDFGSIDLEWLRDIPPDMAKNFLLSIRGIGLKSVECVRLLTLHHLAFPVDTNVGRICVRLGWVPIQPLPESLQLHLLELYPILATIQKYLWPRLCKLDQQTLYELHYHMITFGKVFCTKSKPNCNACPLRSECKHFASAFASARLALPAPQEKSLVKSSNKFDFQSSCMQPLNPSYLPLLEGNIDARDFIPKNQEPIIEEPASPREEYPETMEKEIEDFYKDDEIPTITLNMKAFAQNLEDCIKESNTELQSDDIAKALVAISTEAASIPLPKLKNVHRLRTEHYVYELPDAHPLVQQLELDQRELDDPSPYLLAIWTPDEMKDKCDPPKPCCDPQVEGGLCNNEMCQYCMPERQSQSKYVRGTILVPCRTAMRGSFPLNGTYFQVNEVFADHKSSHNPINVERKHIWNLQRRMVFFGTSVSSIFKGLTTEEIQQCFWRGFVCVRGFDRESRAPKPLCPHLHLVARPKNRKTAATE